MSYKKPDLCDPNLGGYFRSIRLNEQHSHSCQDASPAFVLIKQNRRRVNPLQGCKMPGNERPTNYEMRTACEFEPKLDFSFRFVLTSRYSVAEYTINEQDLPELQSRLFSIRAFFALGKEDD